MAQYDRKYIASMIDHTLLKANATKSQIAELCRQAREYNFASVCVNPYYVKQAAAELEGSGIRICTVVGFPLGANTSDVKAFETRRAVENGAVEIDMVINIGAMKDGDYQCIEDEIRLVVEAAQGNLVKVIIETCYLTDIEKKKACGLAKKAGASFVKTSTGFGTAGATVEDIELMRNTVGNEMGVKASGGIRCLNDTAIMIDAGANRLGTSAGINILKEIL